MFDRGKIGQIGCFFQHLGIFYNALFINDESRSFGNPVHIEYEICVERAVGRGDSFIEIAEQGEVKVLLFFEFSQGEDGIDADAEYLGVGLVVEGDVVPGTAEFLGAGACEGLGEEKQEDVLAFTVGEGYFLFVGIVEAKVGCRLAGLNGGGAHGYNNLGGEDSLKFWTADTIVLNDHLTRVTLP